MAAVMIDDLKTHLRLDLADTSENQLLADKIATAETFVAAYCGVPFHDFGEPTPAPVLEAVRQIAASLYEDREGAGDIMDGTRALLDPYREWSF